MKVPSATHHTASRGGQASTGTFGYASFLAPAVATPAPVQPRRIDGLTFGQRRARLRAGVQAAYIASRKGQLARTPAAPVVAPEPVRPAPPAVATEDKVAAVYARLDKVGNPPLRRAYNPAWNDAQYQEWLDEVHADNIAWQAKMADLATDEFGGCGLGQPTASVPATKLQPVAASTRRSSMDDEPELAHSRWLADLAESYGCPFDEEAALYARSFVGVGHAEHLMALEG